MRSSAKTIGFLTALILVFSSIACSNTESTPISPANSTGLFSQTVPTSEGPQIWGSYHMTFDPETQELTCVENRELSQHFNITKLASPVMKVTFNYYNITVGDYCFDIELTNNSKHVAFDVRAIVVPNPYDPVVFINPDDYTTQFDWIAPGNANGFRAFAKSAHQRAFNPGYSNTQTFIINAPIEYAVPTEWDILITCSYPGNTTDPYEINPQPMKFPVDSIFWSEIRVQVLDWQNDVEHVYVDTWKINGGVMELQREGTSNFWRGLIKNQTGIASGIYECRITADSTPWDSQEQDEDQCTYEYIQIEVQ